MTKGCAYDLNECCVELEAGNCNIRWAGVSVRWKRECSLLEAWEFVEAARRRWRAVKNRRWLVWRIVRRAEEGIETSGETWRSVRLNVAERAVESGGACGWTWGGQWGTRFVLLSWILSRVLLFQTDSWMNMCEERWRALKLQKDTKNNKYKWSKPCGR